MLSRVKKTIKKYNMISNHDKVVLGVSGGMDSVTLLHIMHNLKEELEIQLHVAHLDHQFRGEESRQDAEFVQQLCTQWGIPYTLLEYDVPAYIKKTKLSPEEAARQIRYNFFEQVAKDNKANKVALAHNANDNAETILFNFMRGSGLDGLCGIPPVRDSFYIRPLIEIYRREIEIYMKENNLQFRLDKTNLEKIYTRNKIRLELIPYLEKEFNPNLLSILNRTSKVALAENEYLKEVNQNILAQIARIEKGQAFLQLREFLKQPIALQRRIIKSTFANVSGGDLEFKHIEEVIRFAQKGGSGDRIDLPGNFSLLKDYENLIINHKKEVFNEEFAYQILIPGETIIQETKSKIKTEIIDISREVPEYNNPNVTYIDYEKIPPNIVVRNRRIGDVFSPLGTQGHKKLKNFFIDCKISREMRNNIPVIATGKEIIWVAGFRVSEHWKINWETKKVLKLELCNYKE